MADIYFGKGGVVSLWAGQRRVVPGSNFLRDKFNVEYNDPDNEECIVEDSISPLPDLISGLSYSESFQQAAIKAAERLGVTAALWVMAEFDFAYDPVKAGVQRVPSEPIFLGQFEWHE